MLMHIKIHQRVALVCQISSLIIFKNQRQNLQKLAKLCLFMVKVHICLLNIKHIFTDTSFDMH